MNDYTASLQVQKVVPAERASRLWRGWKMHGGLEEVVTDQREFVVSVR